MLIERVWAMPNPNTFEIKPIIHLLNEFVKKGEIWVDPFARNSKWASITNDINSEFKTTYNMDALDFLKMFKDMEVDGVLFDPPYSPRQIEECYQAINKKVTQEMTTTAFYSSKKNEIARIVKLGGKVICFGWNSSGIGKKYGFEIDRILLIPHGSYRNDTIVTVETKVRHIRRQKELFKKPERILIDKAVEEKENLLDWSK